MARPLRIEYPRAEAIFPDNDKLVRQVTIYLSHKCSGMKLREIGERFNLRDTGITETSRRFVRGTGGDAGDLLTSDADWGLEGTLGTC